MYNRVSEKIKKEIVDLVKIIPYKPVHKHAFIDLNLEWLEKYFEVEPHDQKLLFNPDEEIIAKNGNILIASYRDKIVATAALLKVNSSLCELTKMAVTEKMQGYGIGKKLLNAMIDHAKNKGYTKVILLTSPKLEYAVRLYKSFGFKDSNEPSLLIKNLERCSIQMELELT